MLFAPKTKNSSCHVIATPIQMQLQQNNIPIFLYQKKAEHLANTTIKSVSLQTISIFCNQSNKNRSKRSSMYRSDTGGAFGTLTSFSILLDQFFFFLLKTADFFFNSMLLIYALGTTDHTELCGKGKKIVFTGYVHEFHQTRKTY
jgi:hypothetical protein